MPSITRTQFMDQFRGGIDLNKPSVTETLRSDPALLDKLKGLADAQGVIPASALNRAWSLVDSVDRDGRASTINADGRAGDIFNAFNGQARQPAAASVAGVRMLPMSSARYGDKVAAAATDRAKADSAGYAYDNAPTSPFKNLSGNKVPGESRPSWLKDNNKCNQFVGDALTQAGMRMPTYKMKDGTEHYVNAEKLPQYTNHFDRITDPSEVKPGDVFVMDYPGSGESTAHTEVITGHDTAAGTFKTTGAHSDGAYEKDRGDMFEGYTYDAANKRWDNGGTTLYILRPKMPATPATPVRI